MRDIEPGSGSGKRDEAGSGTGPLLAIWASKKSPDLAISDLSRFPPPTENPPSSQSARSNWRKARERLFTLKREIDAALKALEEVRQLCFQLADARRDVAKGETTLAALLAQRPPLEASRSHRQGDVEAAQKEHGRRAADVQQHRQIRPGFFVRLFRTEHWKVWSGTNTPLVDAEADAARLLQTAERALSQATVALNALVANIRKAKGA